MVRTQAQARGWSKEQTDSYLDSLKGSKEEVALISLAYNNVDAPKAVGAMLDGDPVTTRKEILYRSNGDKTTLTESEMRDMIASAQVDYRGWRSGDPLKAHTYEKVQDWHAAIYGDGPQASDGGKPAEAVPVRPIPEQPSPHATPDGEDLWQATGRIGRKVADSGAIDGFDHAVKGLQRGLNILGEANSLPARSPAYGPYTKLGPVTEDGKYGPLFRDPLDNKAPKVEGGVFQETLNRIGGRRYDDWTPLKVDDWIGPKTTAAFGRVLRDEDADSLTSAFGKGLGLL